MTKTPEARRPNWVNSMTRLAMLLVTCMAPLALTTGAGALAPDLTTLTTGGSVSSLVSDGDALYLSEAATNQVRKVDLGSGTSTVVLGNTDGSSGGGPTQLNGPRGLTLDGEDLYVADRNNNRVQKLDLTSGAVETIAGGALGSDSDQLHFPTDIEVSSGYLYVADTFNHRIQRVNLANGTPETIVTGGFTLSFGGGGYAYFSDVLRIPEAITISGTTLFVADTGHHLIHSLDLSTPGAVPVRVLGTGSSGDGANELSSPAGVAAHNGLLYISDRGNDRLQQMNLTTGEILTIAGTGSAGFEANELDQQNHIQVADDQLLIADTGNSRIQVMKIDTTNPTITMIQETIRLGTDHGLNFECADDSEAADITCTALLDGVASANGSRVDTSSRGTKTLTITATDTQGNTTSESFSVTIHGKREVTGDFAGTAGNSGFVARLYMASFLRNPDTAGHAYWRSRIDQGDQLVVLAQHFISGPEFRSPHRQLSNSEFVELMYNNVLARTSEPEGRSYWTARLNSGLSRSGMLLLFADSPEFRNITFTS